MAEVIIDIKNLVKKYNKFEAVKGINLQIFKGEIFGFLGPNGAGKTTTLEIIETLRDET
jgi:ABC-2 type transport system ATP-binding protein